MVAYNFQGWLVPKIEAGTKRNTIRAIGKRRHARPGDELQLYTGQRTKACRLIGRATCLDVRPIFLQFGKVAIDDVIVVGGRSIPPAEMRAFAQGDGFDDIDHMRRFWWKLYGKPAQESFLAEPLRFDGVFVQWGALR